LSGTEVVQTGLDIVGVVDPTGVADGINAGIFLEQGDYGNALLSGAGLVPYVGDVAKVPRIAKGLDKIGDAIQSVAKASDLTTLKKGSDEWNAVVSGISELGKGKANVRVETATDAKELLKQSRGNMNRYKNYSKDKGVTYKKGYETHNSQNAREVGAGNDLQHIKWKDGVHFIFSR
jgi:hypothetical protein